MYRKHSQEALALAELTNIFVLALGTNDPLVMNNRYVQLWMDQHWDLVVDLLGNESTGAWLRSKNLPLNVLREKLSAHLQAEDVRLGVAQAEVPSAEA